MAADDGDPRAPGTPEREAKKLEDRIGVLDDHLDEARSKAQVTREAAQGAEDVAGDWEDTEGGPLHNDDPVGAAENEGHHRER